MQFRNTVCNIVFYIHCLIYNFCIQIHPDLQGHPVVLNPQRTLSLLAGPNLAMMEALQSQAMSLKSAWLVKKSGPKLCMLTFQTLHASKLLHTGSKIKFILGWKSLKHWIEMDVVCWNTIIHLKTGFVFHAKRSGIWKCHIFLLSLFCLYIHLWILCVNVYW